MAVSAGVVSAFTGIGSLLFSKEESRKTRSQTKDAAKSAEEKSAAAAQAVIDEAAASDLAAEQKKRKRATELATGGRAAQFKTGPLGVTGQATIQKKTLLGA